MPHSYNKIWIHAIYATKEREALINSGIENKVYEHLRDQLVALGCPVRIINGMPDHVHLLFLLNPQKAITDVLKQVKGNTSHWVNESSLMPQKFAWQTGYAAFSVSESQVDRIYRYIFKQKEKHKTKSFTEEYEAFIKLHGLVF